MAGEFKCPMCPATYTRPQHVTRHQRSHTGDKPFKCDLDPECTAAYTRSDLLARHKRLHHLPASPDSSASSATGAVVFRPLDPARLKKKRKTADLAAASINKRAKKVDPAPISSLSKKTEMTVKPKAGGFGFETAGGSLAATKSWTALLEEFDMLEDVEEKERMGADVLVQPVSQSREDSVHTWIDNSFSTSPFTYTFPTDDVLDLSSFGSSSDSSRSAPSDNPTFASSFAENLNNSAYLFSPPAALVPSLVPDFAPAPSSFERAMEAALAQFVAPHIGHAVSQATVKESGYPFPQQLDFGGALEERSKTGFQLRLPERKMKM